MDNRSGKQLRYDRERHDRSAERWRGLSTMNLASGAVFVALGSGREVLYLFGFGMLLLCVGLAMAYVYVRTSVQAENASLELIRREPADG